jgi:tetratricopeptide (TPR) repeat protein
MLNPKQKNFGHWLLFVIWCLIFVIFNSAYALTLNKVKDYFLNGDYESAISEGEKILANSGRDSSYLDELYYILGLSYLKEGNYLRASDIFEIIIKEFRNSPYKEEATLGLGDTYFLRQDFPKAQEHYKELLDSHPTTKLRAALYYRLGEVAAKLGDTLQAKKYLDKLREEFPLNLEAKLNKDLRSLSDIYYTVQVGSFAKSTNAGNMCSKLITEGYDAYVQQIKADNDTLMYRVRVGRLKSRQEAVELENKLSAEGYPTKILP